EPSRAGERAGSCPRAIRTPTPLAFPSGTVLAAGRMPRMTVDALSQENAAGGTPREAAGPWSDHVFDEPLLHRPPEAPRHIGVIEGEGIGPQLVRGALDVLAAVEESTPCRFTVRAVRAPGGVAGPLRLSESLASFCGETFEAGGALLVGPGGGRF